MRVKVLWFFSLFMVFSGLLGPITPSEADESNGFENSRLAISGDVICVINPDSKVTCRGLNSFEERSAPLSLGSVVSIQGGGDGNFCAITSARNLRCWSSFGIFFEPPGTVKQVSVKFGLACAVNQANRLTCWDLTNTDPPIALPDVGEINQVKTNGAQICVIDKSYTGRCWKSSAKAQSGVVIPSDLGKIKQIEIDTNQICILDFSDRVLCSRGKDGKFQKLDLRLMLPSESLPSAKFFSLGPVTSCLASKLGKLTCWRWTTKAFRVRLIDGNSGFTSFSTAVSEVVFSSMSGSEKIIVLTETGYVRLAVNESSSSLRVLQNNAQFGQIFTPIKHVGEPSVSVTGKFIVGQLITSKVDNWDTRFTTNFQWMRDGVEIEGENGPNHRLRIEDIGSVISLRAIGSTYGGETFEALSNELSINKATINGSPCSDSKKKSVDGWADVTDWKNTNGQPAITGKTEFGKSVKGNYGFWDKDVSLCSFWSVGNGDYLKDSGGILKLTGREVGQSLRLVVLGRNKAGITVVRFSNESNVSKVAFPSTELPKISTVQVGKPITVQPNWASGTKYTCEWGTEPSKSEDSRVYGCTYTPKPSDLGYVVTVSVCGTHAGYISFCRAGLVGVTLPPDMPKIGLVKIATKSPKVGSILKGEVSGFMDGVTIESQWLANGVPIMSANNSEYQVPGSLKGSSISYKVTVSLHGYMTITKVSSPVKIP